MLLSWADIASGKRVSGGDHFPYLGGDRTEEDADFIAALEGAGLVEEEDEDGGERS